MVSMSSQDAQPVSTSLSASSTIAAAVARLRRGQPDREHLLERPVPAVVRDDEEVLVLLNVAKAGTRNVAEAGTVDAATEQVRHGVPRQASAAQAGRLRRTIRRISSASPLASRSSAALA
jgi:hypothetical protein